MRGTDRAEGRWAEMPRRLRAEPEGVLQVVMLSLENSVLSRHEGTA